MILYILESSSLIEDINFYKGISFIDDERKNKIMKLKIRAEQARSLGAGLLFQYGLKQSIKSEENIIEICTIDKLYKEIKKPSNPKIRYGEHGKPYLMGDSCHFNLSHSKDYVVCAFSNRPIGVDIQFHKEVTDKFRAYVLTEAEKKENDNFYDYFSAKEAYMKLTGEGMKKPLKEIEVDFKNNRMIDFRDKNKIATLKKVESIKNYSIIVAQFL